ncbi:MAG: hypothetical protein WBG46_08325 [Nonlabens sp.]
MKFEKEFKEAISHLPSKEKDRLILRLLKKDLALANRLHFELLDGDSADDRREKMRERIDRFFSERYSFYSPGYLMMDLRYRSGDINEHVNITKDKYGEVDLSLHLLITALKKDNEYLAQAGFSKSRKCLIYIIAKVFKIMMLSRKLHEDIQYDFREKFEELGTLIGMNPRLMEMAIHHGLDVNWLLDADIPDDIEAIHKDLRQRGFLKSTGR